MGCACGAVRAARRSRLQRRSGSARRVLERPGAGVAALSADSLAAGPGAGATRSAGTDPAQDHRRACRVSDAGRDRSSLSPPAGIGRRRRQRRRRRRRAESAGVLWRGSSSRPGTDRDASTGRPEHGSGGAGSSPRHCAPRRCACALEPVGPLPVAARRCRNGHGSGASRGIRLGKQPGAGRPGRRPASRAAESESGC